MHYFIVLAVGHAARRTFIGRQTIEVTANYGVRQRLIRGPTLMEGVRRAASGRSLLAGGITFQA